MKQELLKGLTEEQIAKVKACKSQEELLALAKEEGIELNEEQLEAVNGGYYTPTGKCKKCSSKNTECLGYWGGSYHYHCLDCDWYFMAD